MGRIRFELTLRFVLYLVSCFESSQWRHYHRLTTCDSAIVADVENFGGAFVVLIIGLAGGVIASILEFIWNSRKNAYVDRVRVICMLSLADAKCFERTFTCVHSVFEANSQGFLQQKERNVSFLRRHHLDPTVGMTFVFSFFSWSCLISGSKLVNHES